MFTKALAKVGAALIKAARWLTRHLEVIEGVIATIQTVKKPKSE
jgi:hypothetical protein